MQDFTPRITALRTRLEETAGYLRVDDLRARRPQLETELAVVVLQRGEAVGAEGDDFSNTARLEQLDIFLGHAVEDVFIT
jgi:hypothetical protein